MVIPKEVTAATLDGKRISLNKLWLRRQSTKFNGVSYITQRGAEAIYTPQGKKQVKAMIDYYMENARLMKRMFSKTGLRFFGGDNAPYLWLKAPEDMTAWKFFDKLLYEAHVVSTPGIGFGPSGEGYVRITSFGDKSDCEEGAERICRCL